MSPAAKKKLTRIFILMVIIFMGYTYFFGESGYFALNNMHSHLDSLIVVRDSLNIQLEEMKRRIELLEKGDLQAVEEVARSREMAKPGEQLIIIQFDTTAEVKSK